VFFFFFKEKSIWNKNKST